MINRMILNLPLKAEGYYFEFRKHMTEHDNILNMQCDVFYSESMKVLSSFNLRSNILSMVAAEIRSIVAASVNSNIKIGGI